MAAREEEALAELRAALKGPDVSFHLVQTFTHGRAVQVKVKTRKVGPLIFPPHGGTEADSLRLLAGLLEDERAAEATP